MTAELTSPPDAWTIRRVLDWTKGYLATHGSPSPRLDAEILLAHARNCPRIQLYTNFDEVLTDEVRGRMRELVKRRAAHEPVAYLVGHREFFSLQFEVNRDVLIPRPETETLVMLTLEAIQSVRSPQVLDVGTGCACIAVAVAANAPSASITALDSGAAALAVARRNAARHEVADRVTFLQGDLFEPLNHHARFLDSTPAAPSSRGASERPTCPVIAHSDLGESARFDVIVSNPPYIATSEADRLPPDVSAHEPPEALFAGDDGLVFIRRIVAESPRFLAPSGTLLIEFSPEQTDAVSSLLNKNGAFEDVTILRDLSQNPRVVRAVKLKNDE